jgi:hypothetical protein
MEARGDRDALLEQQILALSPDRFEMLTFELVHLDHPDAVRVATPDGGADTIIMGEQVRVWQAKHHRQKINWSNCVESLERARDRWQPVSITFVFSLDLTEAQLRTFRERLIEAPGSPEVGLWTRSHLLGLLTRNPNLLRRFFGASQGDLVETLDLGARAGGPADTTPQILSRLAALGEAADRQDPNFEYRYTVGPPRPDREAGADASFWLTINTKETEIWLEGIPRPGASYLPVIEFSDDETGREARLDFVGALAKGEGFSGDRPGMKITPPPATGITELEDAGYGFHWVIDSIRPGRIVVVYIEIEEPGGRATGWRLETRVVPPRRPYDACFAAWIGTCLVEISIRMMTERAIFVKFDYGPRLADKAALNDEGGHYLLAANSNGSLRFRIPDANLEAPPYQLISPYSRQDVEGLRVLKDRFAALRLLEGAFHREFPSPSEPFSFQESLNILIAAELWRHTIAHESYFALKVHVRQSQLPGVYGQFRGPVRMPARFVICRVGVELGEAEYQYPALKIGSVRTLETRLDPLCEITLEAAEDGRRSRVKLLNRAPRVLGQSDLPMN